MNGLNDIGWYTVGQTERYATYVYVQKNTPVHYNVNPLTLQEVIKNIVLIIYSSHLPGLVPGAARGWC